MEDPIGEQRRMDLVASDEQNVPTSVTISPVRAESATYGLHDNIENQKPVLLPVEQSTGRVKRDKRKALEVLANALRDMPVKQNVVISTLEGRDS